MRRAAFSAAPKTIENLSVNSYGLPPTDEGCGKRQERSVAGLCLLKAHEQFAKAIQPGVGALDDPSARLVIGVPLFLVSFLPAGLHVKLIVVQTAGRLGREANVSRIGAERFDLPAAGIWAGTDDGGQSGAQ
jgi:hypothetical protein